MPHVNIEHRADKGRAKVSEIDINGKKAEGPRRAVHMSSKGKGEMSLFHDNVNATPVTELYIQMREARLRKILTDSREHQSVKDDIKRMVEAAGADSINHLRIGLENQPVPGLPPEQQRPHGPPTRAAVVKLFDLCDVPGIDMVSLPTPTRYVDQWAKMATQVFRERRPDYLNEFMLIGSLPTSLPESDAAKLLAYYRKENLDGIYIDFLARKVPETWMRSLVDVDDKAWADTFALGGNVQADLSIGNWRKSKVAAYDLLAQVYGIDAHSNQRFGMGSDNEGVTTKQFAQKLLRKRYRLTDTYGAYTHDGLKAYMENHNAIRCPCPTCRRSNPLDLYDRYHPSEEGVEQLGTALRTHRTFVTHTEMQKLNEVIKKGGYADHIDQKVEATNEVAAIMQAIGRHDSSEFF